MDYENKVTVYFSGNHTGLLYIHAKVDGSVSDTCGVIDALFFDDCSTNRISTDYSVNNSYCQASYDSTHKNILLTRTNRANGYLDVRSLAETVKGKTVTFECDLSVQNCSGNLQVYLYEGHPSQSNLQTTSEWTHHKVEKVEIPLDATTGFFRVNYQGAVDGATVRIKNFTVYYDE